MTGQSVRIVVPREVPSLNTFMRKHWAARNRERDGWRADIWHLVTRDRGWLESMAAIGKKMRVAIHSERSRLLDKDNLCVKHVLDALVRNGFLADDSPEHIDLHVSQSKGPNHETRIEISEAQ